MSGRWWLVEEDVDPRAGDRAAGDRLRELILAVDAAARRVDEIGRGLHQRELGPAKEAESLLGPRAMHRDEIGAAEQLLQHDLLGAARGDFLYREIGIVGPHGHLEHGPPARAETAAAQEK